MVQKLILIRHGEPQTPTPERYCIGGRTDWPLSDAGIRQCEKLAEELLPRIRSERAEGRSVEIWSSPLRRAVQTAEFLCENGERPKIREGFREMDAGEWEGKSFHQIRLEYPEIYEAREKNTGMSLIPGAEKDIDGLRRFTTELKNAFDTAAPGMLIVVAHSTVIRLFLNSLLPKDTLWSKERLPYTGIAEPDIAAVRQKLYTE